MRRGRRSVWDGRPPRDSRRADRHRSCDRSEGRSVTHLDPPDAGDHPRDSNDRRQRARQRNGTTDRPISTSQAAFPSELDNKRQVPRRSFESRAGALRGARVVSPPAAGFTRNLCPGSAQALAALSDSPERERRGDPSSQVAERAALIWAPHPPAAQERVPRPLPRGNRRLHEDQPRRDEVTTGTGWRRSWSPGTTPLTTLQFLPPTI